MVVAGEFGLEVEPDDLRQAMVYVEGQRGDLENLEEKRIRRKVDKADKVVVKE